MRATLAFNGLILEAKFGYYSNVNENCCMNFLNFEQISSLVKLTKILWRIKLPLKDVNFFETWKDSKNAFKAFRGVRKSKNKPINQIFFP